METTNIQKKLVFLLMSAMVSTVIYAQIAANIYTPNGNKVPSAIYPDYEFTDFARLASDNHFKKYYPNAEFLSTSSELYNCHSYAWYMTESGNLIVWIDGDGKISEGIFGGPSIYWRDGSYIETTVNDKEATKVSYVSDDHSAITTSEKDVFISKWGNGPLMRHHRSHAPFKSEKLRYF